MVLKIQLFLISTVEFTSLDLSIMLQHLKIWAHLTFRNSQYPVMGVQLLTKSIRLFYTSHLIWKISQYVYKTEIQTSWNLYILAFLDTAAYQLKNISC